MPDFTFKNNIYIGGNNGCQWILHSDLATYSVHSELAHHTMGSVCKVTLTAQFKTIHQGQALLSENRFMELLSQCRKCSMNLFSCIVLQIGQFLPVNIFSSCLGGKNGPLARRGLSNIIFLISLHVTSGALSEHFRWRLMYSVQWEM